jgi:hypothetical protein
MEDVKVEDLLDDINTDAMTPAWVCFRHLPEDIALDAYAGLIVDGKRVFGERALLDGNFEVIVSGSARAPVRRARPRRAGREVVGHRARRSRTRSRRSTRATTSTSGSSWGTTPC